MTKLHIKKSIYDIMWGFSLIMAFATFSFERSRFEDNYYSSLWIQAH